jgi:hypothetical protein
MTRQLKSAYALFKPSVGSSVQSGSKPLHVCEHGSTRSLYRYAGRLLASKPPTGYNGFAHPSRQVLFPIHRNPAAKSPSKGTKAWRRPYRDVSMANALFTCQPCVCSIKPSSDIMKTQMRLCGECRHRHVTRCTEATTVFINSVCD